MCQREGELYQMALTYPGCPKCDFRKSSFWGSSPKLSKVL